MGKDTQIQKLLSCEGSWHLRSYGRSSGRRSCTIKKTNRERRRRHDSCRRRVSRRLIGVHSLHVRALRGGCSSSSTICSWISGFRSFQCGQEVQALQEILIPPQKAWPVGLWALQSQKSTDGPPRITKRCAPMVCQAHGEKQIPQPSKLALQRPPVVFRCMTIPLYITDLVHDCVYVC